ncbi:nuclear transport factor 2 family protein [Jiangella ureilytica]|uniref:Nuclear transport factor 2 family protein n=1 Tax=Jiangella ureilytica TaxID=2530374 RepID=A0A4R4RFH0_9ACTN|nr:nuclear transport factor 2 family protein [Jiangella ureilytica]TDC48047.1 nuclear transport factor 2 family protein [Jiangella ureilytica]
MTTTISAAPEAPSVEATVDAYLAAWTEPDDGRRRALIERCFTATGAVVDPPLDGHGHDGIDALMRTLQAHYPGTRFVRTTAVDVHHDAFRAGWELRDADGAAVLTGTDHATLAADGRIERITGFFGDLTPLPAIAGAAGPAGGAAVTGGSAATDGAVTDGAA